MTTRTRDELLALFRMVFVPNDEGDVTVAETRDALLDFITSVAFLGGVDFTQADADKLAGIESNATRDQTSAQIRDRLAALTGDNRLDATAVKNIPSSEGFDPLPPKTHNFPANPANYVWHNYDDGSGGRWDLLPHISDVPDVPDDPEVGTPATYHVLKNNPSGESVSALWTTILVESDGITIDGTKTEWGTGDTTVAEWSSTTTYATGQLVTYDNGDVWMSMEDGNLNNVPSGNGNQWWYRFNIGLQNEINSNAQDIAALTAAFNRLPHGDAALAPLVPIVEEIEDFFGVYDSHAANNTQHENPHFSEVVDNSFTTKYSRDATLSGLTVDDVAAGFRSILFSSKGSDDAILTRGTLPFMRRGPNNVLQVINGPVPAHDDNTIRAHVSSIGPTNPVDDNVNNTQTITWTGTAFPANATSRNRRISVSVLLIGIPDIPNNTSTVSMSAVNVPLDNPASRLSLTYLHLPFVPSGAYISLVLYMETNGQFTLEASGATQGVTVSNATITFRDAYAQPVVPQVNNFTTLQVNDVDFVLADDDLLIVQTGADVTSAANTHVLVSCTVLKADGTFPTVSPLTVDLADFSNEDGVITFGNADFKFAVTDRYYSHAERRTMAGNETVEYFFGLERLEKMSERQFTGDLDFTGTLKISGKVQPATPDEASNPTTYGIKVPDSTSDDPPSYVEVVAAEPAKATLTSGATVNWDVAVGPIGQLLANENFTLAEPTNPKAYGFYLLEVTQDSVGSRTITLATTIERGTLVAPVLSTGGGKTDYLLLMYTGAKWRYLGIRKGY